MEVRLNKCEQAFADILWYNGYFGRPEELKEGEKYIVDLIIDLLTARRNADSTEVLLSSDLETYIKLATVSEDVMGFNSWGSEPHMIWMMLVGMFGDWGTSIRTGWLEPKKFQDCINFLNACKQYILGTEE